MARAAMVVLIGTVVAAWVTAGAAAAQTPTSDPVIGTWKLNVERSAYVPGPRPPADQVTIYQFSALEGGWTRFVMSSTNAQGAPTFLLATFKVDGERRPYHNQDTLGRFMVTGQQTNLTRSYRRIDARTVEFTSYTDGVAGLPVVRALAPDGMTYTQSTRGTNAQGVAVNNVLVFERVR